MSMSWIIIGILSFVFSHLLNTLLLKFSSNLGIRNNQVSIIRFNKTSKPALGGISMYLVFLFFLVYLSFSNPILFDQRWSFAVLLGASLAVLVGFYDDAYNTKPFVKFFGQVLCASILIYFNVHIELFESKYLNILFTYLWVIGIMNSINMLDNMDSVATLSTIIIISSALVLNIDDAQQTPMLLTLSVVLIMTLANFLWFNWHPSKMFMGDTGSQFLGFFLAVVGIEFIFNINTTQYTYYESKFMPFLFLFLVFLVPLTDTFSVSVNRMLKGKSPFVGGRDHTTHYLYYLGLTERMVALVIVIAGVLASTSAALIYYSHKTMFVWFSLIGLVASLFLYLNTRETYHHWFKKTIFRNKTSAQIDFMSEVDEKLKTIVSQETISNEKRP